ncbi:MAG: SGNH/GDSL hydrolase family protein [Siculibacillus sp.]|nr:SGNH/GDSL hydrolase family protein [Siculibacillus sp.]
MTDRRPVLLAVALVAAIASATAIFLARDDDGEALVFAAHARLRGQALLSRVAQRPPATLVFGDSLVEGTAIDELCGEPALAAGAWGARLADIAAIAAPIVAAAKPNRVVVVVGINDAIRARATDPTAFAAAQRALIESWRAAGISVSLATLAPIVRGRPLGDAHFDPAHVARLNREIRALAADLGSRLVAFDTLADTPDGLDPTLAPDGVHPNPAGYRRWHAKLEEAVCAVAAPGR